MNLGGIIIKGSNFVFDEVLAIRSDWKLRSLLEHLEARSSGETFPKWQQTGNHFPVVTRSASASS